MASRSIFLKCWSKKNVKIKLPIIPSGIVACTFSYNLRSRNSYVRWCLSTDKKNCFQSVLKEVTAFMHATFRCLVIVLSKKCLSVHIRQSIQCSVELVGCSGWCDWLWFHKADIELLLPLVYKNTNRYVHLLWLSHREGFKLIYYLGLPEMLCFCLATLCDWLNSSPI